MRPMPSLLAEPSRPREIIFGIAEFVVLEEGGGEFEVDLWKDGVVSEQYRRLRSSRSAAFNEHHQLKRILDFIFLVHVDLSRTIVLFMPNFNRRYSPICDVEV